MVATVVAAQLAMPLAALVTAPSQFGFQMFSGAGWTRVLVEDSSGQVHQHEVAEYAAKARIDIDWTERLPERVCEVDADAVRVTVKRWRTERSLACP